MGHFSHDLQPQHGSSPAICLAASWPACPSAMGLSIKENACCLLHCLCLEQPLPQHLSLVPGHPHHLSVLFSSTSQKHACVTVSNPQAVHLRVQILNSAVARVHRRRELERQWWAPYSPVKQVPNPLSQSPIHRYLAGQADQRSFK